MALLLTHRLQMQLGHAAMALERVRACLVAPI